MTGLQLNFVVSRSTKTGAVYVSATWRRRSAGSTQGSRMVRWGSPICTYLPTSAPPKRSFFFEVSHQASRTLQEKVSGPSAAKGMMKGGMLLGLWRQRCAANAWGQWLLQAEKLGVLIAT